MKRTPLLFLVVVLLVVCVLWWLVGSHILELRRSNSTMLAVTVGQTLARSKLDSEHVRYMTIFFDDKTKLTGSASVSGDKLMIANGRTEWEVDGWDDTPFIEMWGTVVGLSCEGQRQLVVWLYESSPSSGVVVIITGQHIRVKLGDAVVLDKIEIQGGVPYEFGVRMDIGDGLVIRLGTQQVRYQPPPGARPNRNSGRRFGIGGVGPLVISDFTCRFH